MVTLDQLRRLGVPASTARGWAKTGWLHRKYPGVYAIGTPKLTREGIWLAAVYACGPGAVLSHRDAAALHGLRANSRPTIEVTSPGRRGRTLAGIQVRSAATLTAKDATAVREIPCTTVARTLVDLASVVARDIEAALDRAEDLRVLDVAEVLTAIERAGNRPGSSVLRAALARRRDPELLRSELERVFLELCRGTGRPLPLVNHWIEVPGGGLEVDFCWPDHRLVVEVDGYASHGTRSAFERDRERDQLLLAAGWRVARFTWRQITREARQVAERLVTMLAWQETLT